MRRMLVSAAWVAAAIVFATAFFQPVGATAVAGNGKSVAGRGIVYLFRGGADIFSTGMDDLAAKLRARGVDARSLGFASWQDVAREAKERRDKTRQPIILLGHSFGANAAVLVAQQLAKVKTPAALIILFDPTAVLQVPPNVTRLVNFYSSTVIGMNLQVQPGPQFTGKLENVAQADIGHLDIDNDVRLHDRAIRDILRVLGLSGRVIAGQQ